MTAVTTRAARTPAVDGLPDLRDRTLRRAAFGAGGRQLRLFLDDGAILIVSAATDERDQPTLEVDLVAARPHAPGRQPALAPR